MCSRILLLIALFYMIVWIQPVTQCSAQDHINYICKCLRFLNIRNITKKIEMFYDGAYSRRIIHYGRANVYGSARIHRWEEICREGSGSVEKRDRSLTLHFCEPISWDLLIESKKFYASWLIANHHGLQWKDGMIPYSIAKRLITIAVTGTEKDDDDDNEALVYVKEFKKCAWLKDTLESETWDDTIIETLDTDCENVESLKNCRWY